jgi:hypothetical protein
VTIEEPPPPFNPIPDMDTIQRLNTASAVLLTQIDAALNPPPSAEGRTAATPTVDNLAQNLILVATTLVNVSNVVADEIARRVATESGVITPTE